MIGQLEADRSRRNHPSHTRRKTNRRHTGQCFSSTARRRSSFMSRQIVDRCTPNLRAWAVWNPRVVPQLIDSKARSMRASRRHSARSCRMALKCRRPDARRHTSSQLVSALQSLVAHICQPHLLLTCRDYRVNQTSDGTQHVAVSAAAAAQTIGSSYAAALPLGDLPRFSAQLR